MPLGARVLVIGLLVGVFVFFSIELRDNFGADSFVQAKCVLVKTRFYRDGSNPAHCVDRTYGLPMQGRMVIATWNAPDDDCFDDQAAAEADAANKDRFSVPCWYNRERPDSLRLEKPSPGKGIFLVVFVAALLVPAIVLHRRARRPNESSIDADSSD